MAKKLIDILSDAAVVRDETNEKANTAERVGGVLVELANYLSAFAPVSNVTVEADGANVRLVLHLKNEDGTVSTRGVTLPAATTANAGVLTPELLKALQKADTANEDLAQEGISKAESASMMLFAEEAARKEADLSLNDLIEAEVTERLQSVEAEKAERKAADDELRGMADEGLSKADAALSQIHEEIQERAAQDRALVEAVSQERADRTAADEELQAKINETRENTAEYLNQLKEKVDGNNAAIAAETEARTSEDAELKAKIQDHEDRIWKLENQWYGIEWDTEVSSPAVTRIGNMDLHRTLPIQSRMRGCLLDDNGKVTKYLNPKDWTGEVRDGSRGQVMVEIPMHYRRCETDGTKRRVKLSEYPLPGYHQVPRMYVSAYEATLQRSTNKLCSVVNTDPDFRGGNNNAAWDGTHKSGLGKPANGFSLNNARTAARKRGKEGDTQWNCYTYDIHVTLTWLYVVEYANRNSQLPFNAELTAEGFHQGGIDGTFIINYSNWSSYFSSLPIIPCGHTDALGNGTGVVPLHVETDDGAFSLDWNVHRYRGVEVPFGHLGTVLDGILLVRPDTSSAWTAYACSDPANFSYDSVKKYRMIGTLPSNSGYISDIHFGELGDVTTASSVGVSSTSKFCDHYGYNYSSLSLTISTTYFGGTILNLYEKGIFLMLFGFLPINTPSEVGTRLCFLPAE